MLFFISYMKAHCPSYIDKYTILEVYHHNGSLVIHKKGDKKSVTNYRPISLLCIASKIMERIVQDELYAKVLHLIDPRQHGFLPSKSCATNLIGLIHDVAQSLHKNTDTDIIYFDFAKAFDTVNHNTFSIN